MILNKLPADYDGEQKRRIRFNSLEDKAAYDADGLVWSAQDNLFLAGVSAATFENEQIYEDAQRLVGTHRKDLKELLSAALCARMDIYDQDAEKRQELRQKYEQYIDGLQLSLGISEADVLKLKAMISEDSWLNAIATAREMHASKLPTYEQILKKIFGYTPERVRYERLKNICAFMKEPGIVVVADSDLEKMIEAIDKKSHCAGINGSQEPTKVSKAHSSPYETQDPRTNIKVIVADVAPRGRSVSSLPACMGEISAKLTEEYQKRGMRLPRPHEMATIIQQSFRRAKAANDPSLIVDFREQDKGTVTVLATNPNSPHVAYSCFYQPENRVRFGLRQRREHKFTDACGRSVMPLLDEI